MLAFTSLKIFKKHDKIDNRKENVMNSNKKQNLLIFALIFIIVILSGLLIYVLTTKKESNSTQKDSEEVIEGVKITKRLINTDSSGNDYYIIDLYIDDEDFPEHSYESLKIYSTKDNKTYNNILDLTRMLYSVYTDAPYEGYKIEDGNLYYVNSDGDSEQFECGEEVKVTLNNNKYTLTKTGKTYKDGAGERCN